MNRLARKCLLGCSEQHLHFFTLPHSLCPCLRRVMRVVLDPSKPNAVLKYEAFLSGGVPGDTGLPSGPNPPVTPGATYNGRPADVEQLPDGSLLVSDDFANAVYRITFNGASGCHTSNTKKPSKDKMLGSRGRRLTEDKPCCGYGTDKPTLTGAVVQGADQGCAVNLGATLGAVKYRRCLKYDMSGKWAGVHCCAHRQAGLHSTLPKWLQKCG